jgi:hypothetical protein
MDYVKTFEQYQKYGMEKKFEQLPDYSRYKKEKAWYEVSRLNKKDYPANWLLRHRILVLP